MEERIGNEAEEEGYIYQSTDSSLHEARRELEQIERLLNGMERLFNRQQIFAKH